MLNEHDATNLDELFRNLERSPAPPGSAGTAIRRISSQSKCDIFIGVQKPSHARVLTVRFNTNVVDTDFRLPAFRVLELQTSQVLENDTEKFVVTLRSPDASYNDVFTSLVDDISSKVGACTNEAEAIVLLQRRIVQWQRLMQKQVQTSLTPEEQRGLYGELWFLSNIALSHLSNNDALNAWTGPEGTLKDFQFIGGVAAEIKTAIARHPQVVIISDERQLDDSGLTRLFLFCLLIEVVQGTGDTLPQLISRIREQLSDDALALAIFEDKLLEVKYLSIHISHYSTHGYLRRGIHTYAVSTGFPRITQNNIIQGVENVKYSVSIEACKQFAVTVEDIFSQIGQAL